MMPFATVYLVNDCWNPRLRPLKPEVLTSRLLDHKETRFKVLKLWFLGRVLRWYTLEHWATLAEVQFQDGGCHSKCIENMSTKSTNRNIHSLMRTKKCEPWLHHCCCKLNFFKILKRNKSFNAAYFYCLCYILREFVVYNWTRHTSYAMRL